MSYGGRFNDESGGGFLQGSQSNTQSPGGKEKADQTLRPVTIKQLVEADVSHSDSVFAIQDVEVVNVSFCAVVRKITRNPTNVLIQVEDGTGTIEVRKWIESSDGEIEGLDPETGVQEQEWVRVIGGVKSFNQKRNVAVLRIQKITDFNMINYHLLDVVRITLQYERGISNENYMAVDHPNPATTAARVLSAQHDHRPPRQAKIMAMFTDQEIPDEGIHLAEIARTCGMKLEDVEEETNKLKAAGELYATVDDNHLKPTN
ncbi:hypothetical protein CROQUDRAFT_665413 [Cronartium quercuum f. sp. fusiforme G11]|uniref:Replication protein A C-terminal domain-containing protein n=1 Tax=Cronartium quercuum f. sp. fusiforme G11 TaxID=708437 RepID=A0A9P6N793_9BASI|nr:hypothetical protein CROQUDRAFT_665413 [Cronartium quercuum f. sp. fusiforme G11]